MFANKKELKYKLFLIWVFAGFLFTGVCYAQEPTDTTSQATITNALNTGNSEVLRSFLNTKVDITLPNQAGIYSNTQAYYILKEFFLHNTPTSFQIINESENNGSNFIVGKMHTVNQHFRVCYLTKFTDNKLLIYQFSIEK